MQLMILKKKTLDAQPKNDFFFHETFNTKTQNKNDCQNMCLCNQKYIWDLDEKNIIDYGSWEKCDHCKKHHELYLNYNSENSFSLWADMMEKKLKWNKQQDLDDENQKATHNNEFKKKSKYTLQQWSIIFGMLQGRKWVSMKNQTLPKIGKDRSQAAPDNH